MKEKQSRGLRCPNEAENEASGTGGSLCLSASNIPARKENAFQQSESLLEKMLTRDNLIQAMKRVERNKGSSGVDGMSTQDLRPYLKTHWLEIKESLLHGVYRPQAIRKVEIPKPGGGKRQLGIPTVLDRFIQQAIQQVLSPLWEEVFSESSYGFRPGRSAHDAIKSCQKYIQSGKRWVVDIDLAQFFDRVNHDRLMFKLSEKIKDKRLLKLIRSYLETGIMSEGLVSVKTEGTPQGSPLSPLLSNIVLDELDKELESRGHSFCRYADDSNIYVNSHRAGQRVFESLKRFIEEKLRLKVNESKSAVARVWQRKFLGYTFTWHKGTRLKVSKESVKRLKARIRQLCRKGRGRNLARFIQEDLTPVLRGWIYYFRLSEVRGVFEALDSWLRRKLRCILWRQWRRPKTRFKKLKTQGLSESHARKSAWNGRGAWWNSGASHMNLAFPKKFFEKSGLISLSDKHLQLRRT